MVDSDVARRRHEHLLARRLPQQPHERRARDGLARAGRALDHGERLLQRRLQRGELRVVGRRHARRLVRRRPRQAHGARLGVVAEELVEEEEAHAVGVLCKGLEPRLHAVVRRRVPQQLRREAVRGLRRHRRALGGVQLEGELLGRGDAHNDAAALPRRAAGAGCTRARTLAARATPHTPPACRRV